MKKFKKSKKRIEKEREEKEKKSSGLSKTAWMGLFIAAIMILSIIGFMWKGNDIQDIDYNGFKFTLTPERIFVMEYQGQGIGFYNHPSEVEGIEIDPAAAASLKNTKMIYVTSDPEDDLIESIGKAEYEIKSVMDIKGAYFIYAFTKANEYNKSIIDCINSTPNVPVILFRKANSTAIENNNSCIIAESDSASGMISLRDRLIYAILGVIE